MAESWGNLREDKSGFRIKKEGPVSFIFLGSKHVGNIIDPILGGKTSKALKHTAMTKNWGLKSTHDSRHSALEWIKQKHKSHMSTRISEEADHALAHSDSNVIKDHFQNLYSAHIRTGMAPKYFKSPEHLARIAEMQHGVKSGTYTRHLHEGMETKTVGSTSLSRQDGSITKHQDRVNKKDPASLLKPTKGDSQDSVSEAFLKVYKEAKEKQGLKDKELTDNGLSVDKPNPQMVKGKGDTFQIKKTETGEVGTVITIDPPIKNKPGNPDNVSTDHKSKPNT